MQRQNTVFRASLWSHGPMAKEAIKMKVMSEIIRRKHKYDSSHIDFSEADAMNEEDIEAAAKRDPDAQPLTEENIKNLNIKRPNREIKGADDE